MKYWAEISKDRHKLRFENLNQVLNHYKVEHEGRHLTPEEGEDFFTCLKEVQSYASVIHFRSPFVHVRSADGQILTELVDRLRARDSMLKENGKWWTQNHLYQSLSKFFTLFQMPVDLRGGGLVLGSGGRARTSVAVLSQLGIKKVTVIDLEDKWAFKAAENLKKHFWGATIESQSHRLLTHLPGMYSIVINGLSREKESELKNEISYFNFLYPSGIYIDLKSSSDPGLMEEAEKVGARVVYGAKITSLADAHWLKLSFGLKAPLREIADQLPQGNNPL